MTLNLKTANTILQRLEKAVTAGNIAAFVPEDLEVQAHNTLWHESHPTELTLLKLIPSGPATSVAHEFTQITSFGDRRHDGWFSERSLPSETSITTERKVTQVKIMGEIGPTFILAALEETQSVLGQTGAVNIERAALRKNVLWKKNRNLYFSDTSKIRQGEAGLRARGLEQQIREGTDGTVGTSPYGSHIIDMEGDPLTISTLRNKAAEIITLFGSLTTLIMDPFTRGDLEQSLDSAYRLDLPISAQPYMLGQQVAGLQTQGGIVRFHTDNILTPIWRGQYNATPLEGAPLGIEPTTATAGAPSTGVSKWDAASAGDVYYVITTMKNGYESTGTRVPATGYTTVTAAQGVAISITPKDGTVDSFKIYRGTDADDAITKAYFIQEVANSGGGSAVAYEDLNTERPNTGRAFALNVLSDSQEALAGAASNGLGQAYFSARERSADFLGQEDRSQNTVSCINLGPAMGILPLASVLAEVDRPLMYSAMTPQVRNPLQNIVFKNIGRP